MRGERILNKGEAANAPLMWLTEQSLRVSLLDHPPSRMNTDYLLKTKQNTQYLFLAYLCRRLELD